MPINQNKPNRRSIRLKSYDYTSPGWYYITICAHNRACLFGDINHGKMVLNAFGKIVEYHWQRIPHHFKHVELDEFTVMPNHIHGILVIVGRNANVGAKHSISDHSIKNVNVDENASPLQSTSSNISNRPKGTQPGSISAIIQNFSSVSTRKINHIRNAPGTKFWQRNY